MPTFGTIPQSEALREASPESLRELLEKDPYKLTPEELEKQVMAIRAHRERVAKGDAKPSKQKKETKKADEPRKATSESADELGF